MTEQDHHTTDQDPSPLFPKRRGCAWLMFAIMVIISAVWGACLGAFVFVLDDAQTTVRVVEDFRPKIGSKVYSADGELLGEFTTEARQVVSLSEMPLHLQKAFIAEEDATFYSHKGVRPLAILSAIRDMLVSGRVRGASTITQQLARNIEGTGVSRAQTYQRKIKEAIVALQLERQFTKDEILELYLNQSFLGVSAHGVEAAAQQYFGKSCRDLTLAESATLAGLTPAPNSYQPFRYPERAKRRRDIVLKQMLENAFITQAEYDAAIAESLDDSVITPEERLAREQNGEEFWGPNKFKAPYFVEEVRQFLLNPPPPHEVHAEKDDIFEDGLTVYTTVDMRLQRAAEEVLFKALDAFDEKQRKYFVARGREDDFVPLSGALVCIDNRPGYEGFVRAMVGGRDFEKQKFNNATQAQRQAGSSFKPFVWLAALDNGFTPSNIELDEEIVRIDGAGEEWRPKNFSSTFRGPVTLRNALASSINIISVKLVERLGMPLVRTYVERAGVETPISDEVGLTIGLGSPVVTVLELCNAFSTFAKGGIRVDPIIVKEVYDRDGFIRYNYRNFTKKTRAFPEDVTYALTYLLEGVCQPGYMRNGEWVSGGSGWRTQALERPRAGKTGTTNESRNVWFSGFTPDYTCVVWLGYEDNRPMREEGQVNVTGGNTACPVWTDFMVQAHEGLPVHDFRRPQGVMFYYVDRQTGLLGGDFPEVFIRNTTPPTHMPQFTADDEIERALNAQALESL